MNTEECQNSENKITFKKINKKNICRRKNSESSSNEDEDDKDQLLSRLEESKELRKIRRKHGGVTAEALLHAKKEKKKEKDDDPYKVKTGGMLDLETVKNTPKVDDAYDTGIGTAFSAETNRRDEDAEMQKFIEENLAKRKGVKKDKVEKGEENKYLSPEEAALQSVPDYLRKSSSKKNEEMLSNQMLSGIPEVDLGLEAKIRNIEATEEAKQKLLRRFNDEKGETFRICSQKYGLNIEDSNTPKEKKKTKSKVQEVIEPVVGGGVKISTVAPKRLQNEKATDDFHYEKFRKQFRRH
ncbi:Uncharacterized protein Anas_03196 [Armadillidium nasatum]|uniref:Telomere length and silencing protein 1-like protein n=1 Tax=Armadillidium nasatum TaxID=96803 RepID=A0A5N5THH6_9CRUS|nr:Uncharacterized protein Anas_03196 [Armadillidium nasatum]